jgi:hypothetical protein
MENNLTATEDVWFIVKNGEQTQYGELKNGQTITTKNPIDTYTTEESWKAALKSFGIDLA